MTEPYSRCPPVERDDGILIHVTTICTEPIAGPAAAAAASLLALSPSLVKKVSFSGNVATSE